MADFAITLDAPINALTEPGFFHRYEGTELVRGMNAVTDGVSQEALWHDRASYTIMLKPEQLDHSFLNSVGQLPYLIRLAEFTVNPANLTNLAVFEAVALQNPNNIFIHHKPISPSFPSFFTPSPEQIPGIIPLEGQAGDSGSVTGAPTGGNPGVFPTAPTSDVQAICWMKSALPWNMPLYLRWWVPAGQAGHKALYDFYIGQFCLRCGPTVVEVFRDVSPMGDRSVMASLGPGARMPLFSNGPVESVSNFSNIVNHRVSEWAGHIRSLLWLPYRRAYVYLESSYGHYGVFKAQPFETGNGLTGAQADWGIVESRPLMVAGLTPGPGMFQIQRVKFADGPGVFNLPPFTTDYKPTAPPAANWLVDFFDAPQGSNVTHSVPATPAPYTYYVNSLDHCTTVDTNPAASDQSRTYGAVYTLTPGTDPTSGGSRKTYTPQLYSVEARLPHAQATWPKAALSFTDKSLASPSARIKRAEFSADVNNPGHFMAEVSDFGSSLGAYYTRSDFPMLFSDQNGMPGNPTLWTTLWAGIAEPPETHELRLDAAPPHEVHLAGSDYWKWLTQRPIGDNRDWTGFGHITVIQSVLQQAGISIANWDGPAPGSIVSKTLPSGQVVDFFQIDAAGFDDPLGGLGDQNFLDPTTGMLPPIADSDMNNPVKPAWRPNFSPPDSFGSFIKRIAEVWSGWDYGFHPDGSFYYHRWDYYTNSEMVFNSSQASAAPRYFRPSVQYEPLPPDANVVGVIAATNGGSLIYSSAFVDFASLLKPTAVNFLGTVKELLIGVPGTLGCDALNKCARSIFDRARRIRNRIHFRGTYVPTLKLGHCFQLQGISGTWRLQSVAATYERQGWDTASYVAELVQAGHD